MTQRKEVMFVLREVKNLVKRPHGQRIKRREVAAHTARAFGKDSPAYTDIMHACDLSRDELRGKKRKNGEPLINHERAVALILMVYLGVRDPNVIIAAFLHDLIEDFDDWTFERIEQLFNLRVAQIVDSVTKPDLPNSMDFDMRSEIIFDKVESGGFEARVLKYADRLHNMITLWGKRKKKAAKIRETLLFVIHMATQDNILWAELTMAVAEQIRKLGLDRREILAGAAV